MFLAMVDRDKVMLKADENTADLMLAVTMICKSIYDLDDLPTDDKRVFKMFVNDELGKLAFADVSALEAEMKRLESENKKKQRSIGDLADELFKAFLGDE